MSEDVNVYSGDRFSTYTQEDLDELAKVEDDFEEPGAGGGYANIFRIRFPSSEGEPALQRQIVVRFADSFERVAVTYEAIRPKSYLMLFERNVRVRQTRFRIKGQRGIRVRYDDAHQQLHRHAPGWPQPGEIVEWFKVEERQKTAFAIAEIRARYDSWEAGFFGTDSAEMVDWL